jgi:pimeloyl-ACP methyl ester carboxylesterase
MRMSIVTVNGVRLAHETSGTGEVPLVMVHGGFESRRTWDEVVPRLGDSFSVLTYDRRGFGESEQSSGQRGFREHVADLGALIEDLDLAPAWAAGQSDGASISLRLAGERPDLLRGVIAHEPGAVSPVADDPAVAPMLEDLSRLVAEITEQIESGDHAGAAERFVEEALGEGLWAKFPPWFRQDVIDNTPNSLDDLSDPDMSDFDLEWVRAFTRPALLTLGDQTAPMFALLTTKIAEAMPAAEVREFTGAGHPIQAEQPERFAEAINTFVREHAA